MSKTMQPIRSNELNYWQNVIWEKFANRKKELETDLFQDVDVLNQLHPKIRRAVALQMTTKGHNPARKAARSVQKAVERDRMQKALTELSESWRDYLNEALVKESRAIVLSKLQPGVLNKGKHAKKKLQKGVLKPVSLI